MQDRRQGERFQASRNSNRQDVDRILKRRLRRNVMSGIVSWEVLDLKPSGDIDRQKTAVIGCWTVIVVQLLVACEPITDLTPWERRSSIQASSAGRASAGKSRRGPPYFGCALKGVA